MFYQQSVVVSPWSAPPPISLALLDPTLWVMLKSLRRSLHACPERAGEEFQTAALVAQFLRAYSPDSLHTGVGGNGVIATFCGEQPGPTVLVRCDLDAVTAEHNERHGGADHNLVRHLCGHDGHMAVVAGLAPLLYCERPARGRVALLFQPAEETGEGAARVLADQRFRDLAPDAALGFHNLPGEPLGSVALSTGVFTCASVGMYVRFIGQASHAAQPELACSPRVPMARLLGMLPELSSPSNDEMARSRADYRLLTITHARMGRECFGVAPGHAELQATLRATTRLSLDVLRGEVESMVRYEALAHGLKVRIDWLEEFPETREDPGLVSLLADVAQESGTPVRHLAAPFPWSDDFGRFSCEYPSVYFGLGIGEHVGGLHQPDYVFPDEIIPVGTVLLERACRRILDGG